MTFVLFFIGFIGLVLLNTKKVADYFKEQIIMTVYLEDTSKDIEITQLQKKLLLNNATKKLNFITKEDAAENFSNEIGENFINFLGYNPLLNSIDIYFNASFINNIFLKNLNYESGGGQVHGIPLIDETAATPTAEETPSSKPATKPDLFS